MEVRATGGAPVGLEDEALSVGRPHRGLVIPAPREATEDTPLEVPQPDIEIGIPPRDGEKVAVR